MILPLSGLATLETLRGDRHPVRYSFEHSVEPEQPQIGHLTHNEGESFFVNLFSAIPLGQALMLRPDEGDAFPILLRTNTGSIRTLTDREIEERSGRK